MAAEHLSTSRRRRLAALAVPAVLMLALSACTGTEAEPAPAAPGSPDTSAAAPSGSSEPELSDSHRAVQTSLSDLLAANPAPSREDIRGAWASAGFSPEAVEVSQDGTPTGLAVDSIISAAPEGTDCLIGEIRDGKLALTTAPALANGQCLFGDDR